MNAKILIVDDEPDIELLFRQLLSAKLRSKEYEMLYASNGVEALTLLAQHPDVDIVLSDINMPEMDGLTLLGKLNESYPILKTVMVSAYGDMANIRVAMNRGAFDFVMKPVELEDVRITIAKTIKHVQELKTRLAAIRENSVLRMYVDESILHFMVAKDFQKELMQTELIQGTVCFIDICGFTAIAEAVSPADVVNVLNDYFDEMVKIIIEHGGSVDKFIGDAILAVFRGNDHVDRAIAACCAIRERVTSLRAQQSQRNAPAPGVSMGVQTGSMLMGNIGSKSLRRLDCTVIGDVVNTASRYQSQAREGEILIDAGIRGHIEAIYECAARGTVTLKNKGKSADLWNVGERRAGATSATP